MRWIITLWICMLGGVLLKAQQTPQYSLYSLNRMAFNPAYAGMEGSISATGVYRGQWVGLAGNPVSQDITIHLPMYFLSSGIGLHIENESIGLERQTGIELAYSYQLPVGKVGILSLGLSGGMWQNTLDGSAIRTPGGNYEGNSIDHNDQLLGDGLSSAASPRFAGGLYFQTERLEVGLSAGNIAPQPLRFDRFNYTLRPSFFGFAAYQMDIGRSLTLTPSVLVKTILAQTQVDFSVMSGFDEKLYLGAGFRGFNANSADAASILAGIRLNKQIRLFYAYDITLSNLRQVSDGSHEVLISYYFGKPIGKGKLPPIIYNPRLR